MNRLALKPALKLKPVRQPKAYGLISEPAEYHAILNALCVYLNRNYPSYQFELVPHGADDRITVKGVKSKRILDRLEDRCKGYVDGFKKGLKAR